jgi:hypothetical protein
MLIHHDPVDMAGVYPDTLSKPLKINYNASKEGMQQTDRLQDSMIEATVDNEKLKATKHRIYASVGMRNVEEMLEEKRRADAATIIR